jgi:hypothetical protein
MLSRSKPQEADRLQALGQQDINARWALYEQFAAASPSRTGVSPVDTAGQASLPVGGEPKGPDGNGAKSSTTTKEVDQ